MQRVRLIIHGVVQGVLFRHYTTKIAQDLNLNGWVRNRADGTVEIAAEGPRNELEKFILWCHRGPAHARVDSVDVSWENPAPEPQGFRIK